MPHVLLSQQRSKDVVVVAIAAVVAAADVDVRIMFFAMCVGGDTPPAPFTTRVENAPPLARVDAIWLSTDLLNFMINRGDDRAVSITIDI